MNALARLRLESENRRHHETPRGFVAELTGALGPPLELLARSNLKLLRVREEILRRRSVAREIRAEETGAHILRTSPHVAFLAAEAGLSSDEVELLRVGNALQAAGRSCIPDAILRKSGRQSPKRTETMRQHASIGHRTLSRTVVALPDTAPHIALSHHERLDGDGYPRALVREPFPMSERIVVIADVLAAPGRAPHRLAGLFERALVERMQAGHAIRIYPPLLDRHLARIDAVLAVGDCFPDDVRARRIAPHPRCSQVAPGPRARGSRSLPVVTPVALR